MTTTTTLVTTETTTTTTTAVIGPPHTLPPPAGSTAVIQSHLILNGSIFVTLSIDKPAYSPREDVHIKATVTNLTPRNVSLHVESAIVWITNGTGKTIWMYPESGLGIIIGPPSIDGIDLDPNEMTLLKTATTDWNLTGLHTVTTEEFNIIHVRVLYDEMPVPAGEYNLVWLPSFGMAESNFQSEGIKDQIPFTITSEG